MAILLNCGAAFISQEVVLTEAKDDIYHRVEAGIRHTVCGGGASEHCSEVIHAVDVDVASGRSLATDMQFVGSLSMFRLRRKKCLC